jgi:hypothetical protein
MCRIYYINIIIRSFWLNKNSFQEETFSGSAIDGSEGVKETYLNFNVKNVPNLGNNIESKSQIRHSSIIFKTWEEGFDMN